MQGLKVCPFSLGWFFWFWCFFWLFFLKKITGCGGITVLAYTTGNNYIKPCEVLGYHSNGGCVQTSVPEMPVNIYLMKY